MADRRVERLEAGLIAIHTRVRYTMPITTYNSTGLVPEKVLVE